MTEGYEFMLGAGGSEDHTNIDEHREMGIGGNSKAPNFQPNATGDMIKDQKNVDSWSKSYMERNDASTWRK